MAGKLQWLDDPNYSREHWTAEDRQAARKAGAIAPASEMYEPLGEFLPTAPLRSLPSGFSLHTAKPSADERTRAAARVLAKYGIR